MRRAVVLLIACGHPAPVPLPPPIVAHVVAPDAGVPDAAPPDAEVIAEEPDANLADDFDLGKVSIGPLHLGETGEDVVKAIGKPKAKSEPVLMGAMGDYVSTWDFPNISLQMSGVKPVGQVRVAAINVAGTSKLKTNAGVGIGSTLPELRAVYGPYFAHTEDADLVLVGSVYGGLLFRMEHERVTAMFLGALAF